jgi:hypothetical protein
MLNASPQQLIDAKPVLCLGGFVSSTFCGVSVYFFVLHLSKDTKSSTNAQHQQNKHEGETKILSFLLLKDECRPPTL